MTPTSRRSRILLLAAALLTASGCASAVQEWVKPGAGRVGRVAVHDELEDRGPRRDEITRLAPVVLLETVHQEDLVLERAVGEVDDHLHPLRRRDAEALHRHRVLEQAAVGGDGDERLPVAERELEEARVRAVQEPEAILAPRHLEERLDDAVHDELVAEETVVVEGVVDQEAVPVELPVLDDESDVELPARQAQGRRGIQLVPGVEEVGVEEEPGEPAVDVRAGDVDGVVVVPVC